MIDDGSIEPVEALRRFRRYMFTDVYRVRDGYILVERNVKRYSINIYYYSSIEDFFILLLLTTLGKDPFKGKPVIRYLAYISDKGRPLAVCREQHQVIRIKTLKSRVFTKMQLCFGQPEKIVELAIKTYTDILVTPEEINDPRLRHVQDLYSGKLKEYLVLVHP